MSRIIRLKLFFVLTSLIYCCCACDVSRLQGESREIDYDAARQKQIVERIYAGTLVPDSGGAVTLPPDLASAAKYGQAFVTQKDNYQLLVLVPTWRGKGSNVKGYLFCKRPLQAGDKHADYYGKEAVDLNVPDGSAKNIVEVQILKVIDDKTLYVYRGLD